MSNVPKMYINSGGLKLLMSHRCDLIFFSDGFSLGIYCSIYCFYDYEFHGRMSNKSINCCSEIFRCIKVL